MNQPDEQKQAFNQWWDEQNDEKMPKTLARDAWQEAWLRAQRAQPSTPPSAWISVRDRLPAAGVSVLGYFKQDMCLCYRNSDGDWSNGKAVISISHWQPLPAPPAPADPFDAWWESLPVSTSFGGGCRTIGDALCGRDTARSFWDSITAALRSQPPTP